MSDPNRPRQSPSGSQHWRQDDQRSPQRESRSSARSDDDYTRPPSRNGSPNSRLPSRDGGLRGRSRDAGRDAEVSRQAKRTRAIDPEDNWDDGWSDNGRAARRPPEDRRTRNVRDEREGRDARGGRGGRDGRDDLARSQRDPWGDDVERSARRHGSSAGASRHGDRDKRGPQGWDDAGWQDDGWGQGAGEWDDDPWVAAAVPARGSSAGLRDERFGREDDAWQPASKRAQGGVGRSGMAGRAGAAWKTATSQVAAVVRNPSTFRERLRTDRKTQIIAGVMLFVILFCMIPTPILA
ncbi:MAG TPA: hypothetical protein VE338_20240, partial [Ktedonobacterales bacterium]|nr:hypothetical protein [Ktedonobacterales bacterium]